MIIPHPRLPVSTEERIQQHLDAGRQQSAVWLYLMWKYGGEWSRWREPETLRQRMAASAYEFCEENHISAYWAGWNVGPVRRAHACVVKMIVHLAHDHFGCPRNWRQTGNRRMWTMDEAQAKLEKRQRELARYTEIARENTNLRHKHLAQWNKLGAQRLYKRGAAHKAIARTLKIDEKTVRGYLS